MTSESAAFRRESLNFRCYTLNAEESVCFSRTKIDIEAARLKMSARSPLRSCVLSGEGSRMGCHFVL